MWFWDYLNLERGNIGTEGWEAFDIWKQAFKTDNPELSELNDLDLIEDYYVSAMTAVFDSWLFKAWRLFYLPSMTLRALTWRLKLYLISHTSLT